MLSDQIAKTEEGAKALVEFMDNPSKEKAKEIDALEEEADELRRVLINELNLTFVTPIDREDIFALSRAIDDIIDYAKSTAEEIILFEAEPDNYIKQMVNIIYEATRDIAYSIHHMKEHPAVSQEHLVRAKKAENRVERRYRQGLAELFRTKDVIKILKTREIYRHLSNAADRTAEAANVISDILVKHA